MCPPAHRPYWLGTEDPNLPGDAYHPSREGITTAYNGNVWPHTEEGFLTIWVADGWNYDASGGRTQKTYESYNACLAHFLVCSTVGELKAALLLAIGHGKWATSAWPRALDYRAAAPAILPPAVAPTPPAATLVPAAAPRAVAEPVVPAVPPPAVKPTAPAPVSYTHLRAHETLR